MRSLGCEREIGWSWRIRCPQPGLQELECVFIPFEERGPAGKNAVVVDFFRGGDDNSGRSLAFGGWPIGLACDDGAQRCISIPTAPDRTVIRFRNWTAIQGVDCLAIPRYCSSVP